MLFNESQGARGACVATNASLSIDLASTNYPIWCGFYDTLGEAGILNCGATASQQYNIDTQATCPPDAAHLHGFCDSHQQPRRADFLGIWCDHH